ncbi:MAG: branched-chain amino acid ABC transporter permease [Deltaproteobacteria bacterium]|nr:MAG: branched-chain amino acid ABC transporter permease [Deltaproteobacteria bacterium]
MTDLTQYILTGLSIGTIYGLIAIGFDLTYNTTGIINFAQGEFVMLGGMFSVAFSRLVGMPMWASMVSAVLLTALVGLVVERTAIRPAKGTSLTGAIIITIGISIVIKATVGCFTKDEFVIPSLPGPESINILGASITAQTLWNMCIGMIIVFLVWAFLKYTFVGMALRAMAENRQGATNLGLAADRLSALSFALSAGIGAVAGVLITPITQMSWLRGTDLGLKGFCGAVLGGMGSLPGAIIGGILIGIAETTGNVLLSGYKDVIAFSIVLLVLYIKPQGIMKGRL